MNSTATSTRTQVANFAAAVFNRDDLVEVRRIPTGRSTWHPACELSRLADGLAADNGAGQHIFVGVNPRTRDGGRKAADVAIGRTAWADFDDTTPADAVKRCADVGMPKPTAVIHSGHGTHCYWRLAESIDVSEWSDLQRDLAALLGSDDSVHDAPRLTRLPGFENPKPPAGSCYIISVDPERRYTLSALRERIPVAPQQSPTPQANGVRRKAASLDVLSRAARYAEKWDSVSEPGRNSAAMRHAAQLRRDFALSFEDAIPILRSWNAGNTPPLDEDELSKCLQNGEQYGKHAVGCIADAPRNQACPVDDDDVSAIGDGEAPPTRERPDKVEADNPDTVPDTPKPAWIMLGDVMRHPEYGVGIPTVTTGLGSLDTLMSGGFRVGCVTIIAGRTGSAKSQLAANIARLASLSGVVTLFVTIEDGVTIAAWRIHSATANLQTRFLLDGIDGMHGPGIDALHKAYGIIADAPLRLCDVRPIADIRTTIRNHADDGGSLVIVDQLSKITTPHLHTAASTYERTSEVSEQLRRVALRHKLALCIVCQVNRTASKRPGDLEVNDLRDSGMIEQDAAAVLLLNTAKDPPTTTGQPKTLVKVLPVRLAKNRFGPSGKTVNLLWHPAMARIDDMSLDAEPGE